MIANPHLDFPGKSTPVPFPAPTPTQVSRTPIQNPTLKFLHEQTLPLNGPYSQAYPPTATTNVEPGFLQTHVLLPNPSLSQGNSACTIMVLPDALEDFVLRSDYEHALFGGPLAFKPT